MIFQLKIPLGFFYSVLSCFKPDGSRSDMVNRGERLSKTDFDVSMTARLTLLISVLLNYPSPSYACFPFFIILLSIPLF
jgi:hypothetical protein